jgi:hypothetical protein
MKLILQPENSALCGQVCVAMAAGVSVKKAIDVIGHEFGTTTADVRDALRGLGIEVADRLRTIGKRKGVIPKRAILCISRKGNKREGRKERGHWMLAWDGEIYDPGGMWPEGYQNWRIVSYLEIY